MKKVIAFTLTILILLTMASCGTKAEKTASVVSETTEAPAPAETTESTESTIPAPTEPEWETGIVRAGYGEAVYRSFEAGTQLKVIGQFKTYYVVEQEDVDLLVSKEMLRMEKEPAFESWKGYAKYGTEVFDNPYLRGESTMTLPLNTQVAVQESHGGWAFIQWDGGEGYVASDMIRKWAISGGSGGTSGGGSNDGTDVPVGSLTTAEDSFQPQVNLLSAYYGPETEAGFDGGMATVLADKTEGYICLLLKGDEVKVTACDDEMATIWLEKELYARIPRWLLKLEGDEDYEAWTGYSTWNGILYGEYQMDTQTGKLSTNQQITVLDEVNGCYVVEYQGQIGYMKPDQVSRQVIATNPGNGSGSGATWTPPKL